MTPYLFFGPNTKRATFTLLRHIQEISGHNDLGTLQRYLEVTLLAETIGYSGDWVLK